MCVVKGCFKTYFPCFLGCQLIRGRCVIDMKGIRGRWPAIFPQQKSRGEMSIIAYQEIYNCYFSVICRQITYMLGNRAVAEEIAQEAFVKLYSKPPNKYENIGGWLSRVATNLAYNYLRSEKSRLLREDKIGRKKCVVDSSEEMVIRDEETRVVRHTLQALQERDRLCLLMKHSGFSYDEISEAIGVKKSSVGTIIARAQAKFKKLYLEKRGSDA